MIEIEKFVRNFFYFFGGEIYEEENYWLIEVPEKLTNLLGNNRLKLVFHPHNLIENSILITHGSYILNQMIDYLAAYGHSAFCPLSKNWNKARHFPNEFTLNNLIVKELHTKQFFRYCYIFNFRIEYFSDERTEEIYTLALNWDLEKWQPISEWYDFFNNKNIDDFAIEEIKQESLPTTELENAYNIACQYAEDYVQKRSNKLEEDILKRLYKQISRLDRFYKEQIRDWELRRLGRNPEKAIERISYLHREFKLKIEEESENHRLKIRIKLINYLLWQIPFLRYTSTLKELNPAHYTNENLEAEQLFIFFRDLHNGQLEAPLCFVCGKPTLVLNACVKQHIVCSDCIRKCALCGCDECISCGAENCYECGLSMCSSCVKHCSDCGKPICNEHSSFCCVCNTPLCSECSQHCSVCGSVLCGEHIHHCIVCNRLIGEKCLIHCAECNAPVCPEHIHNCTVCGQVFDINCLNTCFICDNKVCSSHSLTCVDCGKSICQTHQSNDFSFCAICNKPLCPDCIQICSLCGKIVCPDHLGICKVGNHKLCYNDLLECAICNDFICEEHSVKCELCGKIICPEHLKECKMCKEFYCSDCIDEQNRCMACNSFRKVSVKYVLPPFLSPYANEYNLNRAGHWREVKAGKKRLFLEIGSDEGFIIVMDKDKKIKRVRNLPSKEIWRLLTSKF